jgi:hypothetical protein
MNVSDYRKLYQAEMARRTELAGDAVMPESGARETVAASGADPETRIKAIRSLPLAPTELGGDVSLLLATLRDAAEPTEVRVAALNALKAASFLGPRFSPFRADYLQVLRDIVADAQPPLREDVFEALAMEKDAYAQDLLLRGLSDPGAALVPPAKAIQLLGYDVHADFAPVVRDILQRESDPATKEEAVRLLASDPGSQGLIADLLKDKSQSGAIRALSATALQVLDPRSFEKTAREILADDDEDDDLRATCLGALTHIRDYQETRGDPDFLQRVEKLGSATPSANLRSSAERFVRKRSE